MGLPILHLLKKKFKNRAQLNRTWATILKYKNENENIWPVQFICVLGGRVKFEMNKLMKVLQCMYMYQPT